MSWQGVRLCIPGYSCCLVIISTVSLVSQVFNELSLSLSPPGQVPAFLQIRQKLQLGWLWLRRAGQQWLCFYEVEGWYIILQSPLISLLVLALSSNLCSILFFQEQFLVPDHTIKDISGASFAGFYYICFQKSTATIEGYYYHRSSEW